MHACMYVHTLTGGAISIAINRDELEEAAAQDEGLSTLDGFVGRLADIELIQNASSRCNVEASLTTMSTIEIVLSANVSEEAEYCGEVSEVCGVFLHG